MTRNEMRESPSRLLHYHHHLIAQTARHRAQHIVVSVTERYRCVLTPLDRYKCVLFLRYSKFTTFSVVFVLYVSILLHTFSSFFFHIFVILYHFFVCVGDRQKVFCWRKQRVTWRKMVLKAISHVEKSTRIWCNWQLSIQSIWIVYGWLRLSRAGR